MPKIRRSSELQPKPLFLERMKRLLPEEKDFGNYLKILQENPQVSIRCNTLKISPGKLKIRLENKGWKLTQPFKNFPEIMIIEGKISNNNSQNNDNLDDEYNKNSTDTTKIKRGDITKSPNVIPLAPGELGRSLEHLLGYYYAQEIASMLPVLILNPEENELVLDLASAPGSKTTQISGMMNNKGTVIANELQLGRLKVLKTNLERCGAANVIITKREGSALCEKFYKEGFSFKRILIDAPCSGEGTLRSTPKGFLMWNINNIKQFSNIQKKLIESALRILNKGGTLIYSTCTHAPEENEEVIDFALKNFTDIKTEKINLPKELKVRQGITKWNDKSYSKQVKHACRIYPQDNNTEGFFIAKLVRK